MIDDKEWNNYLKKYQDIYVIKRQPDGIWTIKCNKGNHLDIWSMSNNLLCFSVLNCTSSKGLNNYKSRLKKSKKWYEIAQEGDFEMNVLIKEDDLPSLSDIILPVKRKKTYQKPTTREDMEI